ncbi:hypothetical protein AB0H73_09960 [Streptomyces olivoreticuli]
MTADREVQFSDHFERWVGSLCGVWPEHHGGDWTASLRTAHEQLAAAVARNGNSPYGQVADLLAEAAQAAARRGESPATAEADVLRLLDRAEPLAERARLEAIRNQPSPSELLAMFERMAEEARPGR